MAVSTIQPTPASLVVAPNDALQRFRLYSLWFAIVVGIGNALVVAFNDAATAGWRWAGVAAIAALITWWSLRFRAGGFPLVSIIGEAALLMVIGIASVATLRAVGLFLAAYQLRALYSSRREMPWMLAMLGVGRIGAYAISGDLVSAVSLPSLGSVVFLSYLGVTTQMVADGIIRQAAGESALRRSEDRYRLLASTTTDAVFDLELPTGYVEWTGNLAAFGYSLEDVGNDMAWWMERVHPDDRSRVNAALSDPAGRSANDPVRYRFRRRDGHYVDALGTSIVERNTSGSAARVIGSVRELTDGRIEAA